MKYFPLLLIVLIFTACEKPSTPKVAERMQSTQQIPITCPAAPEACIVTLNIMQSVTPPPPPPVAKFVIGDRVSVTGTGGANVRTSGAISAALLGVQPLGASGIVKGGGIKNTTDGFTWWQIDYDAGVDGWTGEDALTKSTTPPPPPPGGVSVTPASLTFSAALNTDSPYQSVTIKNTGSATVPLTSMLSGAGFNWGSAPVHCEGLTIAANVSCSISVLYHPTTMASSSGALTINAGTPNKTTVVNLSGTVTTAPPPPPTLKPNLSWNASPTPGVTYNLYRSTTKGGPYAPTNSQPITTTSYRDVSAAPQTTYYYVVRASNGALESVNSNEIQAVTP